jgi:hypothetical protein
MFFLFHSVVYLNSLEFFQLLICILAEFTQVLITVLFSSVHHSYCYCFGFIEISSASLLFKSLIVELLGFGGNTLHYFFILVVFLL